MAVAVVVAVAVAVVVVVVVVDGNDQFEEVGVGPLEVGVNPVDPPVGTRESKPNDGSISKVFCVEVGNTVDA